MQFLAALLVFVFAAVSHAQIFSLGRCPDVSVKQNFEVQPYLGKWYEIGRFSTFFQKNQKCGSAHYSLLDNGHLRVNNTNSKYSGETESAIGDARLDDPSKKEGKLGVRFSNWQPYGKYWVLTTDYTSVSVVYSCSTYIGLFKSEYLWILSRTPQVERTRMANLRNLIVGYGIEYDKLIMDDYSGQCSVVH